MSVDEIRQDLLNEITERVISGRCGARSALIGDTFEEALARGEVWQPTVGGIIFRLPGYPFATRQEAVAAAQKMKADTIKWRKAK
jgi:hypothetical protein